MWRGFKFEKIDFYMNETLLNNLKVIILGAPCTGKTTLVNLLREKTSLPLYEMDEEIRKMNSGLWPEKDLYNSLSVEIFNKILSEKRIVYFTSYFPADLLQQAIKTGFKIIQLTCPEDELLKRHSERMSNDPTLEDESEGLKENAKYQQKISEQGIVDFFVPTEINIDITAEKLLVYLKQITQSYAPATKVSA